MKHILVVDDEKPISDIIVFNLKNEGYEVTSILKGMGEYEFIREMFMDKLKEVY